MESIVKDYKVKNIAQDEVDWWRKEWDETTAEVCIAIKYSIVLTLGEKEKLIIKEKWLIDSSTLELSSVGRVERSETRR